MMDSCTAIRGNQSASSSKHYFLFLPVCWYTSVNANNRFSHSIVKTHRHTCSYTQRSGGKENKNLSPHNVSPHNIILAQMVLCGSKARDGAALFTLAAVFINTSRVCTQSTDPRLPIVI